MSRVVDFHEMEEFFGSDPEAALTLLAKNIKAGVMELELRDIQAIGGGLNDSHDTVRLIIDLKVQLVQS